MSPVAELKERIAEHRFRDERAAVADSLSALLLDPGARERITAAAVELVEALRGMKDPGIMEQFLATYGLSTEEGVALMCLAEAYLRTPDAPTVDALIRDKIGSSNWRSHLGETDSFLVNASTWALMLTGQVLRDAGMDEQELTGFMAQAVRRLGEPVVRVAIEQAMKILGRQFVLGASIADALKRAEGMEKKGYCYSYDMLGEAARTAADARRYFLSYSAAISAIADRAVHDDVIANPGISVKLSALHPRYEFVQRKRVLAELVPRISALAEHARSAGICLTVDAEEADRLELSVDVIEAVLGSPDLAGWDGFGVVVQAYAKQAPAVLDWLHALAGKFGRRITVRLVKGAYWDQEIKNAQVLGLENYPVFTRKASTDLSYLRCAQQLFGQADRIYPQFATHNAHTACAVLEMAGDFDGFEFQRLHGMGEALHDLLRKKSGRRCRIYAPVGVHKDLLAYLVRRLLENGANSSFVHQLLNEAVPAASIVADPVGAIAALDDPASPRIPLPSDLFGASRRNSKGVNLNNPVMARALDRAMKPFRRAQWSAAPTLGSGSAGLAPRPVISPVDRQDVLGTVAEADGPLVAAAVERAEPAFAAWQGRPVDERAGILERAADLYEANMAELIAIASREAGKTRLDGVLEVREAVDFCRYYAAEARRHLADGRRSGLGPFVCISPWNFPLAIFTGQVTAALVAGNAVLAKPAEQTPLMAARAAALMHEAGVPEDVLQLLPGDGATVGGALTSDPRVKGVCFTGSLETAILIDRALARHAGPRAPFIAETGGLNAMIVDSTALPEQAVRDIVASAFQSAGQRCSALRVLLVQEEIEETLLEMLEGAAHELHIGHTWDPATDVGPVIDEDARATIVAHCEALDAKGRRLFQVPLPDEAGKGIYVSPAAYRLEAFEELEREIFGPILHVCSFASQDLDAVVDRINASGYGLTLGIHSRVGERVDRICARARVGNIYVNRNQIGAVVGVQPFGGEGLSGTGPKAGGPHYLHRFTRPGQSAVKPVAVPRDADALQAGVDGAPDPALKNWAERARLAQLAWDVRSNRIEKLDAMAGALPPETGEAVTGALRRVAALGPPSVELKGPTGEQNLLLLHGRGIVLCLGGGTDSNHGGGAALAVQAALAMALGNAVLLAEECGKQAVEQIFEACNRAGIPRGLIHSAGGSAELLAHVPEISAVAYSGDGEALWRLRVVLADRPGARLPLIEVLDEPERFVTERVISVDTTASGGNATLLAEMEQDA
jgi:RHH-type transcriptional regulator, proline utilization regulon repressor / proline dehydrogenase / delta 1-pyrroline-5-carboxylate dehydrogenase